jgi:protein TonB
MGFIYVIIGIVAFVTLYDYAISRSWQQVTSASRNDLVFNHKNKNYGAYVLRRNYDSRLFLITISLLFILFTLIFSYNYFGESKDKDKENKKEVYDPMLANLKKPKKENTPPPPPPKEVKPPPPPPAPPVKTVAFPPPVVGLKDDEIIPPDPEIKADVKTQDGDENGGLPVDEEEDRPEPIKNDIVQTNVEPYTFVDEEAEFPGGYTALAEFVMSKYQLPDAYAQLLDMNLINPERPPKIYVKFVVDVNGYVSNISLEAKMVPSCPECDKEAIEVVQKLSRQFVWTPGKIGGKPVPQWYTLPISISPE